MDESPRLLLSRRHFVTSVCASALCLPSMAFGLKSNPNSNVRFYDRKAQGILNDALKDTNFWKGASTHTYTGEKYDEIRLKPLKEGYLCMVTGSGGEDFAPWHVADSVFWHQNKLQQNVPGAMSSILLNHGVDKRVGSEYTDFYLLGDFDFFYGEYYQRMYRTKTSTGGYFLPFERITRKIAGPTQWEEYQEMRDKGVSNAKLRTWLNKVTLIDEYYGMYIIEPEGNGSRVTLVARLRFGSDAGWLAKFASKLPWVLRVGLQNGFNGSVAITQRVKSGEYTAPK